jgi:hypothetical protein
MHSNQKEAVRAQSHLHKAASGHQQIQRSATLPYQQAREPARGTTPSRGSTHVHTPWNNSMQRNQCSFNLAAERN